MSDDVININIDDIAQILASYIRNIYNPLTFGFFLQHSLYYLISTERNTYMIVILMNVYLSCSLTVWRSCCGHAFLGIHPWSSDDIHLNPLTKCIHDNHTYLNSENCHLFI